jgi:hypothetical protein
MRSVSRASNAHSLVSGFQRPFSALAVFTKSGWYGDTVNATVPSILILTSLLAAIAASNCHYKPPVVYGVTKFRNFICPVFNGLPVPYWSREACHSQWCVHSEKCFGFNDLAWPLLTGG